MFEGATIEDDRALLIGSFKHGFGQYDAIQADPELPFSTRTVNANAKPEGEGADGEEGGGEEGTSSATPAAATKVAVQADVDPNLPEWPEPKVLAHRLKRLLRVIELRRMRGENVAISEAVSFS